MPDTNTKTDFEHLSVPDTLKQLWVDSKVGLSEAEAKQRLTQYGPNALEEKKKSPGRCSANFSGGRCPG